MRYFRLYEKLDGRAPLGYGRADGRWNMQGSPLIYCSNTLSLTMLEQYTIRGRAVEDVIWELAELELRDEIPFVELDDLLKDWNSRPYPKSTLLFGTQWASENMGLCLAVPSIRIPLFRFPEEHNLLVNPLHPAFQPSGGKIAKAIEVIKTETIKFTLNGIEKQNA